MATKTAPRGDLAKMLGLEFIEVHMEGTTPLLQHNVRMANPLDPMTRRLKEITSKRVKQLADYEAMADIEWEGGLYHDAELGPFVPAESMWRCLIEGGRLRKLGKQIERGLLIDPTNRLVPIEYDGPRDIDSLRVDPAYRHVAMVGVQRARTVRTRPQFVEWATRARFMWSPAQIDLDRLLESATSAGALIGLGDGRTLGFGRFTVEVRPS